MESRCAARSADGLTRAELFGLGTLERFVEQVLHRDC
jgi:hypothetical protein